MQYSFQKLEVWRLSIEVVNRVYKLIKKFPQSEKFVLVDQLKRAVISIPLNIAEGTSRTKKGFKVFIRNSIGSLLEVVTCLEIAKQQNYISDEESRKIEELLQEIYFKLLKLEKSISQ